MGPPPLSAWPFVCCISDQPPVRVCSRAQDIFHYVYSLLFNRDDGLMCGIPPPSAWPLGSPPTLSDQLPVRVCSCAQNISSSSPVEHTRVNPYKWDPNTTKGNSRASRGSMVVWFTFTDDSYEKSTRAHTG